MLEYLGYVAVVLSLTGNIGVLKKRSWGMGLWVVANVLWIVYDVALKAWPQAALFAVYLVLAVVGFVKWFRQEERCQSP